jgi:GNAT superfamily N-acetyltransferase
MNDAPRVRLAVANDRDVIYALIAELGYPDVDRSRFDVTFDALLKRSDLWVLIAEDKANRKVLGLASMSERPQLRLGASLVTIDEFVISGAARGRGVGALLLAEAKSCAVARGAKRLQLDTNRQRESYRRGFYLKNGFSEADSAVMRLEFSAGARREVTDV